ncbi:EAL domain-containing protein [Roseateles sp. LYH14W]|uniref:EAL domain-containing protein n=1 Tax=Pelomonas parva TaxID=3299032 RepID=A0ABW7FBY6_9BURK
MKNSNSGPGKAAPPTAAHIKGYSASLRQQIQRRAPSALALGYGGFGLAWIVFSDQLLQRVAPDAAILSAVGQGKGIAFVLATSCLLYVVATRRNAPVADGANDAPPSPEASQSPLFWVFALLSAAVVLVSLVGYAASAHKAHEQRVGQLRQEAELKAGVVQGWMERRGAEARALAADPLLRDSVGRWQRSPDEAATTQMRSLLQMLLATGHYADVQLRDERAGLLLAAGTQPLAADAVMARAVQAAVSRREVTSTDLRAEDGDASGALALDLFVPLISEGHDAVVLLLRTAPRRQLPPRLLARPDGEMTETLIFQPRTTSILAVGLDGAETLRTWPADPSEPSLASLSERPSLAGSLVAGLRRGDSPVRAIAAPIGGSAWFVAVQAPQAQLRGMTWPGALALALVDILVLLCAAGALHAAQQRRELRELSRAAAARQENERAWKIAQAIANCSTDAIFAKDRQGRFLFVNRELCRVLGRSPEQLIGFDAATAVAAAQVCHFAADDAAVLRSDKPVSFEARLTTADGERIYACTKGRLDDDGQTLGIYGVCTDVTERLDLQQRMRQWATAFEDVRDGVIITDALGRILSVNRSFTTITGYEAQQAVGSTMQLLRSGRHDAQFYAQMWAAINTSGHWQGEIWNRRKSGETYPEWLTISAVRDDNATVTHYVGVFTDISRIKHSEAQAEWLTHHDPLTHLPNRARLQRRLEEALDRSQRRESRAALLVIDLDGFKTVNDSLGHPAGDELLVCVARRLQARLRQEDFLGRLGGDEFLVIVETGNDSSSVAKLARDLLATVSPPIPLSCGQDAYLTASIGISMFPEEGSPSAVELLRDADTAMYRAKEQGRNQFCFYTQDMTAEARTKLDLESALSRAIERDELLLHYQPQVDGSSGTITGAEALLRWQRSGSGLVAPGQFIPLAERSSLILDIGAWVIDAACRQLRAWMDDGLPIVRVAVNVAARQFAAGDLDQVVARALQRHRIDPQWLEIEITEGMLIVEPGAAIAMLKRIKALGVKLSLDDFGTGYSSLAYLQQFPIDSLKIDQSFTRRIGEQPDGGALVDAVIALAHRLNLRVVAEGVETAQQSDYLRERGCDEMQGYHFGRPAPAETLQQSLAAQGEPPQHEGRALPRRGDSHA